MAIHAFMWSWGKPVAHLMQYHLLKWEVTKVKWLMNSIMTLTVLNLHQKDTPWCNNQDSSKRYKSDIREIK